MYDIWIIGDDFLTELFPTLQAMKKEAKIAKKTPPYLYEEFNIIGYLSTSLGLNRSFMGRIFNNLIEAINKNDKVPKYIMFVLDAGLLQDANFFRWGLGDILDRCLKYMIGEVTKIMDAKIESMLKIKPGAVKYLPKIIWVKMINRSSVPVSKLSLIEDIEGVRRKYNTALERAIAGEKRNFVLELTSMKHHHYDHTGKLLAGGRQQFWRELDYHMKEFDRGLIKLNPIVLNPKPDPKKKLMPYDGEGDKNSSNQTTTQEKSRETRGEHGNWSNKDRDDNRVKLPTPPVSNRPYHHTPRHHERRSRGTSSFYRNSYDRY